MEETFQTIAGIVALLIEAAVVAILAVAAALAAFRLVRIALAGDDTMAVRREVWLKFGVSMVLALEFALAADIIRSAIAPSWDAIGKLAAIAAVRTVLNLFLVRDLETLGRAERDPRD